MSPKEGQIEVQIKEQEMVTIWIDLARFGMVCLNRTLQNWIRKIANSGIYGNHYLLVTKEDNKYTKMIGQSLII